MLFFLGLLAKKNNNFLHAKNALKLKKNRQTVLFSKQMFYLVAISTSLCWDLFQTEQFEELLSTERSKLSQGKVFPNNNDKKELFVCNSVLSITLIEFIKQQQNYSTCMFISTFDMLGQGYKDSCTAWLLSANSAERSSSAHDLGLRAYVFRSGS